MTTADDMAEMIRQANAFRCGDGSDSIDWIWQDGLWFHRSGRIHRDTPDGEIVSSAEAMKESRWLQDYAAWIKAKAAK